MICPAQLVFEPIKDQQAFLQTNTRYRNHLPDTRRQTAHGGRRTTDTGPTYQKPDTKVQIADAKLRILSPVTRYRIPNSGYQTRSKQISGLPHAAACLVPGSCDFKFGIRWLEFGIGVSSSASMVGWTPQVHGITPFPRHSRTF